MTKIIDKKHYLPKMGFHESVVPQVFDGKISTWRLRDHKFKKGDIVAFENSQTGKIFGFGKITKVIITTVGQMDLKDKSHYTTYSNRQELIKAFKRHNPAYEVNNNTPVFAYTYKFRRHAKAVREKLFKKQMKKEKDFYQISLKVILKNGKGEVLILKAAGNGRFAGFYDLPGGRIDTDEFLVPFEEVIRRELIEEVGDVKYTLNPFPVAIARDGPPDLADVPAKGIRMLYVIFEADYLSGDVKISDEHLGLRWVNLEREDLAKLFTLELKKGMEMYLAYKETHKK